LKEFPGLRVEISGHTDNVGDAVANTQLSQARADAVMAALVAEGLPATMFTAVGFGADHPVASNDDRKGRKANRRIEFKILDSASK
jgi:outer membrane protein OmpA-like peptidoglycan-associated protein